MTAEPWLRPSEDINAEQEAVIRRYTARLLEQIVDLIGRAIGDLAPADLASAREPPPFGVNRRRLGDGMRQLPGSSIRTSRS